MIYYTGIGARITPEDVLMLFSQIGKFLASKGLVLRSGHAPGGDKKFEQGCDVAGGAKEIYLPWSKFEGSTSKLIVSNPKAFDIAEKHHPYWRKLSYGAKLLQARNSHQILGLDLSTPSEFVLCWTEGGQGKGGTGQALRIAKAYGIPIFDAGVYPSISDIVVNLKSFLLDNGFLEEKDFN